VQSDEPAAVAEYFMDDTMRFQEEPLCNFDARIAVAEKTCQRLLDPKSPWNWRMPVPPSDRHAVMDQWDWYQGNWNHESDDDGNPADEQDVPMRRHHRPPSLHNRCQKWGVKKRFKLTEHKQRYFRQPITDRRVQAEHKQRYSLQPGLESRFPAKEHVPVKERSIPRSSMRFGDHEISGLEQ